MTEPIKVYSAASLANTLSDDDGRAVSVRQLGRKNYQIVDIAANVDQITEVLYSQLEVHDMRKEKLTVSIQGNGFEYSMRVLTFTA